MKKIIIHNLSFKKVYLVLFFLLSIIVLKAQTEDSAIKEIRKNYSIIKNEINSYDTSMVEIWDESTEGGQAIAYYKKNKLKFIQVVLLGETGKRVFEYYYNNDKLFFAFYQDEHYNRPIYWDEELMKEMGDNEVFGSKKSVFKEERFYFLNEKLIKYLDNAKKEVDLSLMPTKLKGIEVLKYSQKVIKMFAKK